jgi:transcriptional regulator with XRE-family HTH domain
VENVYDRRQAELIECMVEARKGAGLSQQELAKLLGFRSQQAVSAMETGRRVIGVVQLHLFCDALGISFTDLIGIYVERVGHRERGRRSK